MALGAYLNGTLYLVLLGVRGFTTRGYETGRSPSGDQHIAAVGRIASAVGCIGDRGMAATATNTSRRWGESQQQWAVNGSNGDQHIAAATGESRQPAANTLAVGVLRLRWGGELRLFLPLNCSRWGGIVTKL